MFRPLKYFLIHLLLVSNLAVFSQNEAAQWLFGANAGLNFMTNPPSIITGAMITQEGCASISSAAGNLLFYTDGITVYNQSNVMMANGNALNGNFSSTQSGVIVKQPGNNNIYYVFTMGAVGTGSLHYSIVDMSLAAGMGSVTVKNTLLYGPCTEKLTSVRHCNGVDVWVIVHDMNSTNFRCYLVTSMGVNPTPVISAVGTLHNGAVGYLKASPNGRKLALGVYGPNNFELYDFDPSTGNVTNPLILATLSFPYGVEFSPDGTKLYGTREVAGAPIYQWDLCAGNAAAIVASQYTIATSPNNVFVFDLQTAPNGKIYVARYLQTTIGVINNPNVYGAGCNYVDLGQSITPNICRLGLPNFITSFFKPPVPPFTYTVSNPLFGCQGVGFTAPAAIQNMTLGCVSAGFSLTSMAWNFGDPASGPANTSTLSNPIHNFSTLGTFTTNLILYYSCGGGTDTIKQVININQPCITLSSQSITCSNLGSATVAATGGIGPFSYTWMPSGQTGPVATGLSPGTYTVTVFDFGNNFTYTATASFNSMIPLTGSVNNSSSVTCNGAATGTASISNLAGGSGSQFYYWTNGVNSSTVANPTNLTAGIWTYTVTDALTGCILTNAFIISQPPPMVLSLTAGSPSVCTGGSVALNGTVTSGGTPSYNYTWTAGPASSSRTVTPPLGGNYVYSLTAFDSNNCSATGTIAINSVAIPTLTVMNSSICPFQTGTIAAVGAASYSWNGVPGTYNFSDNPLVNTSYTVLGSTQGCTASATASISIHPLPTAGITQNSPLCAGKDLIFSGSGGATYNWTGPAGYNSSAQNNTLSPVQINQAGAYQLTVTSVNGCTATANFNATVNSSPTLAVSGSTVCTSQTLTLGASSSPGATYQWSGPLAFSSAQASVSISNPSLGQAGSYFVLVTAANGCSNSAVVNANVLAPPLPGITLSSNSLCAQGFNGSPNTIALSALGATTYTWLVPGYISNSNPNGSSTQVSALPPGNQSQATATLLGSNGVCAASATATFSIVINPVLSNIPPNPVICAGENFTFIPQGASDYIWTMSPALTAYDNGSFAIANPTQTAVFSVFGSSLSCYSALQTTTITVNPLPQFNIGPSAPSICIGSAIQLSVTGTGASYSWAPSSGLSATSGSMVYASPSATQNYSVLATLNNCTATSVVQVTVMPLPSPSLHVSKPGFCPGEVVSLEGFGGTSYYWSGPAQVNLSGQSVTFTPLNSGFAGIYTLTALGPTGCHSSITTSITIYELPIASLKGSKTQGCVPFCSSFEIDAALSPFVAVTDWKLGQQAFPPDDFSYCFSHVGNYTITAGLKDLSTQCLNTVPFIVYAFPIPTANFEFIPEKPVEMIHEVNFINTSEGEQLKNFDWHFINNAGYRSKSRHPSYFFSDAGTYPVALKVTNTWGCSDTVVKAVTVEADFYIYVPNAFTPNKDEINETFQPKGSGIISYNFMIYDRWGELIFETSDFNKGWDGTYKGQPCKSDVYAWKIAVTGKQGISKSLAGSVTLYR